MAWKSFFRPACYAALVVLFGVTSFCLWAQTEDTQPSDASKSWIATTEPQASANVNPTRTTETHKETGNRTLDTQSVEQLGPDGHFEPYFDTEKESVRVNATTVRTVVRTFGRDGGGQRTLTQVTEEERESLPNGGEKVVRTTSNPDMDGHLPVVRREVTDTRKTGPDTQETKTTVFLSDGSGGLAPSMQIRERQKHSGDHTVEVQKSTLLLDGAGNWQVHERKESTIRENGKDRTTEERVSRPEYDGGKLSVASRSIAKESETASGEKRDSVETYSTDIQGSAPDGKLHLSQKGTTVRRPRSDGSQATEQQVEQPNPGDPGGGLQVTTRTIDIVSTNASGRQQTRTIQARDGGGDLSIVSVETRKSNQTHAVQVDTAPRDKPK
jgi:hypothetical protein